MAPIKRSFIDITCVLLVVAMTSGFVILKQPRSVAPQHADILALEFRDENSKTVMVAAHRGDWRNAPENSIPAIENCIAMGVDIVEIDVKKTRDGVLVIMHDDRIDRTTTGKGRVGEWTLDSLKQLQLRNGLGTPTRYKVPTLEEALRACRGKILVNLDKCYPYWKEAFAIAQKTGTLEHCIMKASKTAGHVSSDGGEMLKEMLFMPVVNLDEANASAKVRDFQDKIAPDAFEFIFSTDTSQVIQQFAAIKRKGARVWINSLWPSLCAAHDDDLALGDIEQSYGWLLKTGATVIQTDRPALLLDYLRKKGRHH